MNRAQRRAHAWMWRLIALVLVAVIGAALIARERIAEASAAVSAKRTP